MKAGKIVIGLLGLLVVVAFAGAAYLASYLDEQRDILERGFSKALGREVRIENGVSLRLSMTPSVTLDGIWIGNADWASGPYLARAGQAVLEFDLMALLSRRLEVRQVRLMDADIRLETDDHGRYNWSFSGQSGGGVELTIDELKVQDSSLHYRGSMGSDYSLVVPDLEFDSRKDGQLVLKGGLNYRDVPLSLSGTAAYKADAGIDVRGFTIRIGMPDAALTIAGDVSGIRNFLRLQVDLESERLDLRKWLSPLWPEMAFDGALKQVSARFNSAGDNGDSLIRNAAGELKIASAVLTPPTGKGAKPGGVELNGFSARLVPDGVVKFQTALAYEGQSYQVNLSGGSLADLFTRGKSWDKLKVRAKGQTAGRPIEVTGEVGPWSNRRGGGLGLNLSLRHEDLKVALNGSLAHLGRLQGSRFAVKASAPSLARLTPWLGTTMPESPPFAFSANIEGAEHQLRLNDLKLTAGKSDVGGKMSFPLTKDGRMVAVLKSQVLDLEPFLAQSAQVGGGDASLPLEWELPRDSLQGLNGSLRYEAKRLKTGLLELKDLGLDMLLDNEHLKLTMSAEGERLAADVDLRPAGEHWQLSLKHKGKFDLNSLIRVARPADNITKPPMDIDLTLKATGNSLGAILDSADGHFVMVLGAGELDEKFTPSLPLGDVLLTLIDAITLNDKAEQLTKLECAVVQLDIAKGIGTSTKGLALRTDKMNVLGGGALKLRSHEIDLQFKIAQRKGLGINLLGLTDRLIRLTGTLHEPQVAVNVVGAVAYGAAAWATGGITVLYDVIFKRFSAFSNPCDSILAAIEKQH